MLDATQEALLSTLVAAAETLGPTEREPFVVAALEARPRYLSVSHRGLQPALEVYRGELVALEHAELIRAYDRESSTAFIFDVTPLGVSRIRPATAPADAPALGAARDPDRRWGRWIAVGDRPLKTSNMSALWRVRDENDPTRIVRVLKTLRYAKGRGSAAFRRFTREIQTLGDALKGQHVGIIEVLDFSVPSEGDLRDAYYVMPMASGSLKDLARDVRGELAAVIRKMLPVADALSVAHAAGVIHRDIKPDNILLFDGEPVLADFGICYLEEEDRLTRTEAHTVGTDDFVAPELLGGGRAGAIGPAVDVYSFAKTLFAITSGGDVFPRERYDDERYDLVARFGRPELAHLRGLVERMVTEDPSARPQTMADVAALLTAALLSLEDRVPYREGMYAGGSDAASRARHFRRVLATTVDRARRDAIRTELSTAADAAVAIIDAHVATRPRASVGQIHEPSSLAAAAAAEEMLSVGLPLVESDDRDGFAEWLGAIFEPPATREAHLTSERRPILQPAAVLATHAGGALAWKLRRFDLLRQVLDRYLASPGAWIHQQILGNNAAELLPWVKRSMMSSELVQESDSALAADPGPTISMLNGLVGLRLLKGIDAGVFLQFMESPLEFDNPLPFAPGFIDLEWVRELVAVGLRGGPVERDLARVIFDLAPEDFRKMCGDFGDRLQFMSNYSMRQLHWTPYFSLGIDTRDWERWTGASISN